MLLQTLVRETEGHGVVLEPCVGEYGAVGCAGYYDVYGLAWGIR